MAKCQCAHFSTLIKTAHRKSIILIKKSLAIGIENEMKIALSCYNDVSDEEEEEERRKPPNFRRLRLMNFENVHCEAFERLLIVKHHEWNVKKRRRTPSHQLNRSSNILLVLSLLPLLLLPQSFSNDNALSYIMRFSFSNIKCYCEQE